MTPASTVWPGVSPATQAPGAGSPTSACVIAHAAKGKLRHRASEEGAAREHRDPPYWKSWLDPSPTGDRLGGQETPQNEQTQACVSASLTSRRRGASLGSARTIGTSCARAWRGAGRSMRAFASSPPWTRWAWAGRVPGGSCTHTGTRLCLFADAHALVHKHTLTWAPRVRPLALQRIILPSGVPDAPQPWPWGPPSPLHGLRGEA